MSEKIFFFFFELCMPNSCYNKYHMFNFPLYSLCGAGFQKSANQTLCILKCLIPISSESGIIQELESILELCVTRLYVVSLTMRR